MFPVMSQPSASPFHRPKKNMWRKPSLKSKQRMAQWKTRHAYSGSSQNISLEQSMNSTVALRSYPHPLSVQPRTPTRLSPYTSHQYPSSVRWMMMAIAIGHTESNPKTNHSLEGQNHSLEMRGSLFL